MLLGKIATLAVVLRPFGIVLEAVVLLLVLLLLKHFQIKLF